MVSTIEVDGTRYVLERSLPIHLVNDWLFLQKERHRVLSLFRVKEIDWSNGKPKSRKKLKLPRTQFATPHIDTIHLERIERDLIQRLKLQCIPNPVESALKIPMANFALRYADNEITHFSFIEALKNKIENQFGTEIHKISKITATQAGRDIVLEISINACKITV